MFMYQACIGISKISLSRLPMKNLIYLYECLLNEDNNSCKCGQLCSQLVWLTLHYYTNTNHFRLFAINVDLPDVLIVYIQEIDDDDYPFDDGLRFTDAAAELLKKGASAVEVSLLAQKYGWV